MRPTTSDKQCHFKLSGCVADAGYAATSCTPHLLKCYSNTAPQCSADAQCVPGPWGRCVNKATGGGSLNCRRGVSGCECVGPSSSSVMVTGRMWVQPLRPPYVFPEQCAGVGTSLGLAFSGGGSLSYTCLMGFQRALNRMGVRADYVSSCSGGSWFAGVYTFAAARVPPSELLGVSLRPMEASLATLASTNTHATFMGARLLGPRHIESHFFEAMLRKGISMSNAWQYAIEKVFLEPYGLHDKVMAWTPSPNAVAPAPGMPFWLCNSMLLDAKLASSTASVFTLMGGHYPPFVFTPMYAGIPQRLDTPGKTFGGVLAQPQLFNHQLLDDSGGIGGVGATPTPPCSGALVSVRSDGRRRPLLLRDALGTSSAGHAYFYSPQLQTAAAAATADVALDATSVTLFPKYNLWTSSSSGGAPSTAESTLGDGGFVETLNIVSMLARGVRKIISFFHEYPPFTATSCFTALKPLFGAYDASQCRFMDKRVGNATRVFDARLFDGVLAQFQRSFAQGGATYATLMQAPVERNDFLGVAGGYRVDIMFVMESTPSARFNAQLPVEVQRELGKTGLFPNFPAFKVLFTNGLLGGVEGLTLPQVNLLSSYTDWALTSIQPEVAAFLRPHF